MKVCPRKCSYKHVWMETEGKKWSLRRTRVADELLYKREKQELIVLSQNFAICPSSAQFEWPGCIAIKITSAPDEIDLGRLRWG